VEEEGGSGSVYTGRDPVIPARWEGRRGREWHDQSKLGIAVQGRTVRGKRVRTAVHKSDCVEALEEGTLVEGTWNSVSRNTAERVGKSSQIGEAEIGQNP